MLSIDDTYAYLFSVRYQGLENTPRNSDVYTSLVCYPNIPSIPYQKVIPFLGPRFVRFCEFTLPFVGIGRLVGYCGEGIPITDGLVSYYTSIVSIPVESQTLQGLQVGVRLRATES